MGNMFSKFEWIEFVFFQRGKVKILGKTNKEGGKVTGKGEPCSIVNCFKFLFLSRKRSEVNFKLWGPLGGCSLT